METVCLAHEIDDVKTKAVHAIETYEDVNFILDKINEQKRLLDGLTERLSQVNSLVNNFICEHDQAAIVLISAKELLKILRKFIAKTKGHKLYPGYKTSLKTLVNTVDDFEEYMQDFKFRHNVEAQSSMNNLFSGFSISI